MAANLVAFKHAINSMGIRALCALDDSRMVTVHAGCLLRQRIAEIYIQTRENGGTTLTLAKWREVITTD